MFFSWKRIRPETIRKPHNRALAWLSEAATPALGAYARRHSTKVPTPPASWRKGLLIGANHIGDILYCTASLPALTKGLPGCTWDMVAPLPASEALEGNPHIRKIHRLEIPRSRSDHGFAELAAENYDVVVCYNTGMYWRHLKLAVELGISNRVGYIHKGFSSWVTHPLQITYPQAFPAYFRDMTGQITSLPPAWELLPQVYPMEKDNQAATNFYNTCGLSENLPVVAAFATSRQPFGLLPVEFYAESLQLFLSQCRAQVVLMGTETDRPVLEAINAKLDDQAIVAPGKLGLRALVTFLSRCQAVLSSDSGPRHLTNAAGTPVVFAHNTYFSAIEAGSYCVTDHNLRDSGAVSPEQAAHLLIQLITTPRHT